MIAGQTADPNGATVPNSQGEPASQIESDATPAKSLLSLASHRVQDSTRDKTALQNNVTPNEELLQKLAEPVDATSGSEASSNAEAALDNVASQTSRGEGSSDADLQPEIVPAPQVALESERSTVESDVSVSDIAASIHSTFPLLEIAYQERRIAAGKQIAAWGEFDTKLKATSESGPLGFYETYRNSAGVNQPLYGGGEVFGGYRIGRGDFQPWYLERQTNDGGEFKAGVRVPLARNRAIDARRAELWRATYERRRVEPEIRAQLIQFVRDGSIAYWEWIASGRRLKIGESALQLATVRNQQLERKVEVGDVDPPVLQDNLRSIATREAKVIDLQRKVQQNAIKLSLFYRSNAGEPMVLPATRLGDFPALNMSNQDQLGETTNAMLAINDPALQTDVAAAISARPELQALNVLIQSTQVDLAEAQNDCLPNLDAQLAGSQDVGAPSSSKRDKSQFELEAGLYFDLPVQRRKAIGKAQAARGKLIQLSAKRQFAVDKIRVEVQAAATALNAAYQQLARASESRRLAEYMGDVERRKFQLGESDLLAVALREQAAIEAAEGEVDAKLAFFIAQADYNAALARDWPVEVGVAEDAN